MPPRVYYFDPISFPEPALLLSSGTGHDPLDKDNGGSGSEIDLDLTEKEPSVYTDHKASPNLTSPNLHMNYGSESQKERDNEITVRYAA